MFEAEILLWCLGIMKWKTWVARMFFIAACTPLQRVRQFGLHSCCNRYIFKGVLEMWLVSKVKSTLIILTLVMVKMPSHYYKESVQVF